MLAARAVLAAALVACVAADADPVAALLNTTKGGMLLPASPPLFSWDTLPVFMHGQNASGPLNATALRFMSQFPLVTIGGGQDLGSELCCNEEKVAVAAAAIKAHNASVRVMYYLNSLINFPQTHLHAALAGANASRLLLRDARGELVYLGQCGKMRGVNHTLFDHSQPAMRAMWTANVAGVLRANRGLVDGVFADRAGNATAAAEIDLSCVDFAPGQLRAWDAGHWQAIADTQAAVSAITPTGIVVANGADQTAAMGLREGSPPWLARMFENFVPLRRTNVPATDQLAVLANEGTIAQVHADFCEYDSAVYNGSLAAFLIGARAYSYYACTGNAKQQGWGMDQGWDQFSADYRRPLGAPLGNATLGRNGHVWQRKFSAGAVAYLDVSAENGTSWGVGCVRWGDGHVTGAPGCDEAPWTAAEQE
jgi:hypothetical protein